METEQVMKKEKTAGKFAKFLRKEEKKVKKTDDAGGLPTNEIR